MNSNTASNIAGTSCVIFVIGLIFGEPFSMVFGFIGITIGSYYRQKNINEAIDKIRGENK